MKQIRFVVVSYLLSLFGFVFLFVYIYFIHFSNESMNKTNCLRRREDFFVWNGKFKMFDSHFEWFERFINENIQHRLSVFTQNKYWCVKRRCAWLSVNRQYYWHLMATKSCCKCIPQKFMNKFATIYACVNLISSQITI